MTVPVPEHDDPLRDAVALVEAAIGDDALACGVILRNMDAAEVAVNLAKLLSELVADNGRGMGTGPCCFRAWAEQAVNRP